MTTQNTFTHAKMQRTLDSGGYSGALTVTAAGNEHDGGDTLVFVESELLGYLVLTPAEAAELGTALASAAAS
jgi:hypothetical protein